MDKCVFNECGLAVVAYCEVGGAAAAGWIDSANKCVFNELSSAGYYTRKLLNLLFLCVITSSVKSDCIYDLTAEFQDNNSEETR